MISSSATLTISSANDQQSVELGLKFHADESGDVTALRFYKGVDDTGTHTATLWDANGNELAHVTFADETATGWQTATLDSPVQLEAGQDYVVSYHAPSGGYAVTENALTTSIDTGALTVEAHGGVYAYGDQVQFPTETYQASNYFVDVAFTPTTAESATTAAATSAPLLLTDPVASSPATASTTDSLSTLSATAATTTATADAGTASSSDTAQAHMEVGTLSLDNGTNATWQHVDFGQPIDDAIVIAGTPSDNDPTAAVVQIANVTSTGFDMQLAEWEGQSGTHGSEAVSWMAAPKGDYAMTDGTQVTFGQQTVSGQSGSVANIGIDGDSLVFANLSGTGSNVMTDRVAVNAQGGFDYYIQGEQALNGNFSTTGTALNYAVIHDTGAGDIAASGTVRAGSNAASTGTASSGTGYFAEMQSYNDPDTAALRYYTKNGHVDVFAQEETSADKETSHSRETVAWMQVDDGSHDLTTWTGIAHGLDLVS
ncbi:DUF4082 domain-containing protein [Thioclava sp. BHET1]|nr:DUF4082 domain-containing protein [Thioclava sp. BHET1]